MLASFLALEALVLVFAVARGILALAVGVWTVLVLAGVLAQGGLFLWLVLALVLSALL